MPDTGAMNWPDVVLAATAEDPTNLPASDVRILDATVEVLGVCGEQHLTVDMVADRARMSRMTVFRRFGSKQNLIDSAYRREISKALRDITDYAGQTDTALGRATAVATRMVDNAARIPALQWIIRAEPEEVVRMWRDLEPRGQALGRAYISTQLQDSQLQDPLPTLDAEFVADVLIRTVMSLILVPDPAYLKAGLSELEQYIERVVQRLLGQR
ncbi:TetR/AcrR family transcriptional regulator [Mycobacterium sp. CBMA271]|uniref:TetR/AcrR family transcriptional regulator n=1 Tax=unclassified Mycobacteroides TaxID=2618759 RepID=UPI0012DC6BD5|nr:MULTISPECIES: TetR/AcrR family transcriptional regulator [unclassified Mycobacteroides]MUM16718.1 TetR family transcriptional regulator [Mycobacteroides sp. CBMA 326]MUM20192.1 TetR/AcrR family transcriptional regulator [Mycobacteroides sp. CBMA 271]